MVVLVEVVVVVDFDGDGDVEVDATVDGSDHLGQHRDHAFEQLAAAFVTSIGEDLAQLHDVE